MPAKRHNNTSDKEPEHLPHSCDMRIRNGQVVLHDRIDNQLDILIKDGVIVGLVEPGSDVCADRTLDANGGYIAPGFIDIHVHGGAGTGIEARNPDDFVKMLEFHASGGTTGIVPTLRAALLPDMLHSIETILSWKGREGRASGILGIHAEGPYISPQEIGGMNPDRIRNPKREEYEQIFNACCGTLRQVLIAPELPGSDDFIKYMAERNVVVGVSHSCATYEQVEHAVLLGLSHIIHTFNGLLSGLTKRAPGVIGASLCLPGLTNEIIADGCHVHHANIELLLKVRGVDNVIIITDAIEMAGLGDGQYRKSDGRMMEIRNGVTRLVGDTRDALVGSVATMDKCVRVMHEIGCSLPEVIRMASTNPARHLGLAETKGKIAKGMDADIVILDQNLHVQQTIRDGQEIFTGNIRTSIKENCKKVIYNET